MEDSDRLDLGGGLSVQVLGTPGHTRDFLSYYIPEKKILVSSEAVGCHSGYKDYIVSEFIYSYQDYVDSMKRLATLDVEILCQGHHRVFVGGDVRVFFEKSLAVFNILVNAFINFIIRKGFNPCNLRFLSQIYSPNIVKGECSCFITK